MEWNYDFRDYPNFRQETSIQGPTEEIRYFMAVDLKERSRLNIQDISIFKITIFKDNWMKEIGIPRKDKVEFIQNMKSRTSNSINSNSKTV